jgi:bifunctional non-homologous end joining protein LigD
MLELHGVDYRPKPLRERYPLLHHLLPSGNGPLRIAPTWTGETGKERALDIFKSTEREGVVFKDLDAPYTPGRPASGGSQFKLKFHATLSAVVRELNQQRSVVLELLHTKGWKTCGNVGIPANHPIPPVGSVVEVRYLYANLASGCLFQTVYLGLRSDLSPSDCVSDQLKYKSEHEEP